MLALRPTHISAVHHHECSTSKYSRFGILQRQYAPQPLAAPGRRVLTVTVFAKKDDKEHKDGRDLQERSASSTELQAFVDRERLLLAELAAVRGQVDKLLDQQQLLLNMVARLSGLAGSFDQQQSRAAGIAYPPAPSTPPPSPPVQQLTQRPASVPGPAPARPTSAAVRVASSTSSSSSDVPAPNSLAELFRSAAATAAHPASAAAASSIAAAISAVDHGDILSIDNVLGALPPRPSPPAPAAVQSPPPPLPPPPLVFDTLGGFVLSSSPSSSSPSSASPSPAVAKPVEVAKAAPGDAPPDLVLGDDDIYWLSRLHGALEEQGFFPGDDDMENWFFGEGTQAALLSFQASERIPETGVADRATWTALLGAKEVDELYGKAWAPSQTTTPAAASAPASSAAGEVAGAAPPSAAPGGHTLLTRWPVIMEGEGGKVVHALQVALSNSGFHCGEDDMRWWQFGDSTLTALKYFQSCNGVPESGVCDERTWKILLGDTAQPNDIYALRFGGNSDDETDGFDDDMEYSAGDRVWLLGEQRWEKRA